MKKKIILGVIIGILLIVLVPYIKNDILTFKYGEMFKNGYKETGMIDVLVERSNKAFDRIGASHFRITNEEAMKEFEIRKHNKTTYNILSMKVVFTINKVIKMMDSVCYAKMLENDRFNSNITNDRRIKLMSNLKTTFLQKAWIQRLRRSFNRHSKL